MRNESDLGAAAPSGESGSNEPCGSRPSEAELSLAAAMHGLVRQMGETNIHLMMLAQQTAKCLEHIEILVDLVVGSEVEDEEQPRSYLDGTPVS
jgi:dihydroorotase-like cyclic amidohydrolase